MAIDAAGHTDIGAVRKHNEDSLFFDSALGLFVVADGLGGHAAGEVASDIVVKKIEEYIRQAADKESSNSAWSGSIDPDNKLTLNGKRLTAAILFADRAITEDIVIHPERDSMGSTVVACLVEGAQVTLAHVGDSRAYLLRKDSIQQKTRDHSWVAEQVACGLLTKAEAKRHPFRNVITQALGNGAELSVEVSELTIANDEALLLCSDGLSGMVPDEDILTLFNQASNLHDAVHSLVDKAIENGGEDNVSVILLKLAP